MKKSKLGFKLILKDKRLMSNKDIRNWLKHCEEKIADELKEKHKWYRQLSEVVNM